MGEKKIQDRVAELNKQVHDIVRENLKKYIGDAWEVTHVRPMCPPWTYTMKERLDFLKVNPHAFDSWYGEELPQWLLCMLFWLSNKHPEKIDFAEFDKERCHFKKKTPTKKSNLSYRDFLQRERRRRHEHNK